MKTSSHAAFSLHYHIILSVKYRHRCITREMQFRLHEIFAEVCTDWRCTLVEFGAEADHVHLLVEAHPAMNLADFISNLKSVSARHLRKEYASHLSAYFWRPMFWNNAYGVVSAGGHASMAQLLTYIQNQDSPA